MLKEEVPLLLNKEGKILLITKKSEIDAFEYFFYLYIFILPIFQLFGYKEKYDSLIITSRRVIVIEGNEVLRNIIYKKGEKLKFNSMNNRIEFIDENNKERYIGLNFLRTTNKEIQYIKSKINA